MDELQISGKRYLSSRRVAKENGYHTDYIGQLIRGGKVKGQKVGRTWYVEEASFATYLGKEAVEQETVAAPEPVTEPETAAMPVSPALDIEQKIETQVSEETELLANTSEPTVPAHEHEEAAPVVSPTAEPVQSPMPVAPNPVVVKVSAVADAPRTAPASTPIVVRKVIPAAPTGLRYIANTEALIPEIPRNNNGTRLGEVSVSAADIDSNDEEVQVQARPKTRSGARFAVVLGVLAIVFFTLSAVMSSGLSQNINIEAGNQASVSYGLQN